MTHAAAGPHLSGIVGGVGGCAIKLAIGVVEQGPVRPRVLGRRGVPARKVDLQGGAVIECRQAGDVALAREVCDEMERNKMRNLQLLQRRVGLGAWAANKYAGV